MISKSVIVGILITIVIAVVIVYFMMKSHPSSPRRPTQPRRSYLQTTDGNYLVVNDGKRLAVSKNIQDATPLAFVKCPTSGKFCLRSLTGLYITIGGTNYITYSSNLGLVRIFITDLSGSGTLGLDGYNQEFDMTGLGFAAGISNPPVWNLVQ